ncbi:hypothetical protein K435DRAFT_95270 [Dendrothele bispora CBS 962.96]|uniref:Uncharacterized protein n=1 Tax=Dendrothele bispora (strain CBS 962.96) TaxID=1314807 RepID=A0A4S8M2X5_DENBC|nr:hypothetical protein K435DRAFT_95270 [Dendrothele bispora CBS 962.96]
MCHERKIRKGNLVLAPSRQHILFPIFLTSLPQSFKPRPSSSLLYPYVSVKFSIALHNIHFLILPKSSLLLFKLQAMIQQSNWLPSMGEQVSIFQVFCRGRQEGCSHEFFYHWH